MRCILLFSLLGDKICYDIWRRVFSGGMEKALKTLGKMKIYQENIIRVPRQQVGEPGIGGTCRA